VVATRERSVASHRRGRARRLWPWIVLAGLGAIVFAGVLALIPALAARTEMQTGRSELVQARVLLLEGDLTGAERAFERSEAAFGEAADSARNPALRLFGLVPFLGRTIDAVPVFAGAGRTAAAAGSDLVGAIDRLPGGVAALAPRNGRLPVEEIAELEPAITDTRARLDQALLDLRSLPTSWLAGPVAEARDEAVDELGQAADAARAAEALAVALPSLAGSEGERRYFLAAQSPAELRGTGGFIGAFSILRAADGRLRFDPMRSITELADLPERRAPAPPPGFGEPFDRFGGTGFWRNLNMVPHAPTAASLIESLYEETTGERLDGVVFVDPQALAELLEATGPVTPPTFGRELESGTVVDYLANEAYIEFGSAAERKRVLGAAVLSVLERFLDGADPVASLRALADAASGGHLVLHAADPPVQDALEAAGVAGTVDAPRASDFFAVFASNADGTKIDFFIERSLSYEVELGADGRSLTHATMTTRNRAPSNVERSYVFGPYPGTGLDPGVSNAFVTAYCAAGCRLANASLDDETVGAESHTERGLPVFSTFVLTEPGTASELVLDLERPKAWRGDELGGTYRLTIRGQPTVRGTEATIRIGAPPGMRVTDATPGMEIDGGVARWRGELDAKQTFEIRFQRPAAGRLWDFLSTPIFGE
jgi:hypothetical protein